MPRTVLVIPDKFKGTLSAAEAAQAIRSGWRSVHPKDDIHVLPMSDGGDGFGPVHGALLGAKPVRTRTVDAAGRPIRTTWWWEPRTRTAVVESARTIGLAMLPPELQRPLQLSTFGLGRVLEAAAAKGARLCRIGIGGSATNDGGFGLARALGWGFLDQSETPLRNWPDLVRLSRLHPPQSSPLARMRIVVAVDVRNPLLGSQGATRIYGPQKGLAPADIGLAESALRQLARAASGELGLDNAGEPGAGAAGGLGYGLKTFCGATLESGSELFLRIANVARLLSRADLVITAEGAMDRSTLMGKGVGAIARLARELDVPCLGIGGVVRNRRLLREWLSDTCALTPDLTTPEHALSQAKLWTRKAAAELAERTARL